MQIQNGTDFIFIKCIQNFQTVDIGETFIGCHQT